MRIIGHLPNEASATTFGDFLYVEGIHNQVEADKEGWAIWIHSEDQLERARELLGSYLGNPKDPKYARNARQAAEMKERDAQANEEASKRVHDRRKIFRPLGPMGMGPVTLIILLACVGVWAFMWLKPEQEFLHTYFYMTAIEHSGSFLRWSKGLLEIRHGEVWRLISPILVHDWPSPWHLLFNMYAWFALGTMIEARLGSGLLLAQVVIIAALSNLGQYYVSGPYFCGYSGVVYGLLGYVWMRGKFDPDCGLFLHPQTVTMMLVWFVLCLVKIIPNVANTVHGIGLAVGVVWGCLASMPVFRSRL